MCKIWTPWSLLFAEKTFIELSMEVIVLVIGGLRLTLDLALWVLDLNYWLVSALVSFLSWILYFIYSLPGTVAYGLQHSLECISVGLTLLGEYCFTLVLSPFHVLVNALKVLLFCVDYLFLAWNSVVQIKDPIRHGFLNITLCEQKLYQQVSELLTLASSFAVNSVNTLVQVTITVMQSIYFSALSLWFSLLNMISTSKEFIALLFSQISSTVVAVAIFAWSPFQFALDVLGKSNTTIAVMLFKYLYEILLFLFIIWVFHFTLTLSPVVRFLCEKLTRMWHLVLVLLSSMLNSDAWRRVADQSIAFLRMYTVVWNRNFNQRIPNASMRTAGSTNVAGSVHDYNTLTQRPDYSPEMSSLQNHSNARYLSQCSASTSRENEVKNDPWKLLKQQEETRKCVICQDEPKTVLLLPCRHLCLCDQCTQVLLQQPILQRNCPLCRKMILQTLKVYM